MKRVLFFVMLISTILLVGCSKTPSVEYPSRSYGCIPPLTNLDYPINVRSQNTLPDQPPGSPWIEVSEEPADNFATVPFLTRKLQNGGSEIWFVNEWGLIEDGRIKTEVKYILIFNTKNKKWEKINNYFEGTSTQIFGVYELANGDVIADGFSPKEHFFARFDENKMVFIENSEIGNIPDGPLVFDQKRQLFWVFVPKDGIYSIDPINGQIKFWISLPNLYANTFPTYASVRISDNGVIYLLYNTEAMANALYKFVPDDGSFTYVFNPVREYYGLPPDSLYITNSGQLWVDDMGWMEKKGTWHQIVRSPIFIGNRQPDSGYMYSWPFGISFYESQNNFLWFRSY